MAQASESLIQAKVSVRVEEKSQSHQSDTAEGLFAWIPSLNYHLIIQIEEALTKYIK